MSYSNFTARKVGSLTELKSGEHIRVSGSQPPGPSSARRPSSLSSRSGSAFKSTSGVPESKKHCKGHLLSSRSRPSSSTSEGSHSVPERCNSKLYTHHLLVVEPIDDTHVMVIHKVDGEEKKTIFEEEKCYEPSDVSVMEYDCQYTGEEAIRRARERMEEGEEYNVVTSNCEHFVTEARTGEKQCLQKKGAIVGGISGGATGAAVGAGAGASAGALIGGVLGSVIPFGGPLIGAGIGFLIGGVVGVSVGGGAGGAAGGFGGMKWANKVSEEINKFKKRRN